MDYQDYKVQENKKNKHFWHQARLEFLDQELNKIFNGSSLNILDIGCGTGEELEMLSKYGQITALDINKNALELARKKGHECIKADIENYIVPNRSFDLVCAFDILEHLDNDERAIKNIFEGLKDNGKFFFTVPACKTLYGPHDIALDHKRRYDRLIIENKLKKAGFVGIKIKYWNSLLFPLEALYRIMKKSVFKKTKPQYKPESTIPPAPINWLLYQIFKLDNFLIHKGISLPWGLTIYGWAKK